MFNRFHGGNIYSASKKYHIPENKIIDFSANINPLGLSPRVKKIILPSTLTRPRRVSLGLTGTGNLDRYIVHYPDPECRFLRYNLSKFLGIPPDNILIGNGAAELIYLVCQALDQKKVLIPAPSFSEYEHAAKSAGSKCNFVKIDKILSPRQCIGVKEKFDMIFIGNPNNPTGHISPKEEILGLLKALKNETVLLVDEAFIEFVKKYEHISLVKESLHRKNLLVLRSFTKFFAMPGLRIGYLTGNKTIINHIAKHQPPWTVNTLAQLAATEAIKDTKYIKQTRELIDKERAFLFYELKKIKNIRVSVPTANFILCRILDSKLNSAKLADILAKHGILIRDCSNFRGLNNKYFRIAVRTRKENKLLVGMLLDN